MVAIGCPTCQKRELYTINTLFVLIDSSNTYRDRWKDLDWHYWSMGTITNRADQNVLFHLLSSSSPSFSSCSLNSSFKILIHLLFSFSPISSVILPYLCSACSSSSFPFLLLLLSCPAPLPPSTSLSSSLRRSCSTFRASPPSPSLLIQPLIRSIHYSIHRDMIRWLCMGCALLLPILGHTHTYTHPVPLVLMEVDVAFFLKNSVDVLRQRKLATWRSPD